MYKRILVPLDGSTLAACVLPHSQALAKSIGADLVLLRVAFVHIFPGADPIQSQVSAIREAEAYVADLAKGLQTEGISTEAKVRYGDPVEEIIDHIAWDHIDLVVMATHGRTGLKRLVLGSVAENVLRRTSVPMLVMRAASPPEV
jgi:nucleotide-binding universal stress UspA family protein